MEQLEEKIKQYGIKKYRRAARNAVIGLGIGFAGTIVDYEIVHWTMIIGGGLIFGMNIENAVNYLRYSSRKDKHTNYEE